MKLLSHCCALLALHIAFSEAKIYEPCYLPHLNKLVATPSVKLVVILVLSVSVVLAVTLLKA